ncbi:MAG: hypothetical protein HRU19_30780 [Pseudobacteriovorax sp.]|nr:hypothetical protein [Pseudobacteriovorax sp.]
MKIKNISVAKEIIETISRNFEDDDERLELYRMIEELDIEMTTPKAEEIGLKSHLRLVR